MVALGAILYQMPDLRLNMRCTILLVFHSFIDGVCYAVTFLPCGVSLSESKLMVWDPVLTGSIIY